MKFEELILIQSKSLNQDTTLVFTLLVWQFQNVQVNG